MDHRVSKDMISQGMSVAGEKKTDELGGSQYGSAATPSSLMSAYSSMYSEDAKWGYDPKTGKVIASPPENVKSVDLKVIIENPKGELSVKDIKLDFANENAQETKNIIENETKFVSLSSQLSKEYSDWDNYGSQLIDRL